MNTDPRRPRPLPVPASRATAPAAQAGDATQQMQAMLEQTLQTYPPHYQVALQVVQEHPAGGHHFACVGAMETELSEVAMTVCFDFRRGQPAARLLVRVTMSFGKVVAKELRQLQPGESSGIRVFENA